MGRNRSGSDGEDLVIRVPVGTEILDEDQETVLLDLTKSGDRFVFLRGGDGGFGNAHYKTATNQAPRKFTPGWPGQEREIWLRLKLIADAGIIGLPNAGKSTFLAASSAAKPKIAAYPFTTLHPNLGVVKIDNHDFVLADIPGLIEGAHEGHGLGDRFLGHVERTSVLLHLVDITQEDPLAAYHTIREELTEYGEGLDEKIEILALNKIDAIDPEIMISIADQFEKDLGSRPYLISGVSQEGIRPILFKLAEIIESEKKRPEQEELSKHHVPYDPASNIR
jgi:GTP-binding protein